MRRFDANPATINHFLILVFIIILFAICYYTICYFWSYYFDYLNVLDHLMSVMIAMIFECMFLMVSVVLFF